MGIEYSLVFGKQARLTTIANGTMVGSILLRLKQLPDALTNITYLEVNYPGEISTRCQNLLKKAGFTFEHELKITSNSSHYEIWIKEEYR